MFLVVVLSVVLTLAVGPNAALLCSVRCHPAEVTVSCQHQGRTTSRRITGNEGCQDLTVGALALVREDVRREGSVLGKTQSAVVLPRFAFAPPVPNDHRGYEPGGELLLEARPLVLPLRI